MPRFQFILHLSGLSVPVEGDQPIIGCLAARRVLAQNAEEAGQLATESLLAEPRIAGLLEETRAQLGNADAGKVEVEKCENIGWLRWYLSPLPSKLFFYHPEEEPDAKSAGASIP